MAVKGGFEQAVTVLLENGVDVNYLDQVGDFRLIFVCTRKFKLIFLLLFSCIHSTLQ